MVWSRSRSHKGACVQGAGRGGSVCRQSESIAMTQLKFNVAQLLREVVGARREYTFTEESLPLDETLVLRDIHGTVRFTRTTTGVFVHIRAGGVVRLECVRSLESFDYPVQLDVVDEMHSVVDVMTGMALQKPPEEDPFMLDELHMADVGEVIREYTLLELPLNPISEAYRDQPVSYTVQSEGAEDEDDEPVDARLEVLKAWAARQQGESGK